MTYKGWAFYVSHSQLRLVGGRQCWEVMVEAQLDRVLLEWEGGSLVAKRLPFNYAFCMSHRSRFAILRHAIEWLKVQIDGEEIPRLVGNAATLTRFQKTGETP